MASIQHLIKVTTSDGNKSVYRKLRGVRVVTWNTRDSHAAIIIYKGEHLTATLKIGDKTWTATSYK